MPDEPNLSLWLDKSTAAKALGVSERTLERMVQAGKGPECRQRPRPGVKPEPVYNPQDVETLTAAQRSMIVHPDSALGNAEVPQPLSIAGRQLVQVEAVAQCLESVLTTIAANAQQRAAPEPPRLWMTIPQAAHYSGLSQAFLRRLVKARAIPSLRDRAVKIRKEDLDNIDPCRLVSGSKEAE